MLKTTVQALNYSKGYVSQEILVEVSDNAAVES